VEKEAPKVEVGGKQEKGQKSAPKDVKLQEKKSEAKKEQEKPQEKKVSAEDSTAAAQVPNFVLYYLALGEKKTTKESPAKTETAKPAAVKQTSPATEAPKKTEDDFDLFGEDDEDDAREMEIMRKAKEAEDLKKAQGKVRPVAKSIVVIDVSPESAETGKKKKEKKKKKDNKKEKNS
jgi:hypothetical protein